MSKPALPPCQASGLSPAHRELIRLLTKIAVESYLDETEPPLVIGAHK